MTWAFARIWQQTVEVLPRVVEEILEGITDNLLERLSAHIGEHFDDEPASRVIKEIFEVVRLFPQEGIQQCTAEENVVQVSNVMSHKSQSERIMEHTLPLEVVEVIVKVVHTFLQERLHVPRVMEE